jgi:hypothetical protein
VSSRSHAIVTVFHKIAHHSDQVNTIAVSISDPVAQISKVPIQVLKIFDH